MQDKKCKELVRVSETNEVPISSHTWFAPTTFKELWNLQEILEKIATNFYDHESFKKMNCPCPTLP